jgi:hypothetical protein
MSDKVNLNIFKPWDLLSLIVYLLKKHRLWSHSESVITKIFTMV